MARVLLPVFLALVPLLPAQEGGETLTFTPASPTGATGQPIEFTVTVYRGTTLIPALPKDLTIEVTPGTGVEVTPVWLYHRDLDAWRWQYRFVAAQPGAYSLQARYRNGGFGAMAVLVNGSGGDPGLPPPPDTTPLTITIYRDRGDGTVQKLPPGTILTVQGSNRLRFSAQGRDPLGQVTSFKQTWRLAGSELGTLQPDPATGTTTLAVAATPPAGQFTLSVLNADDPRAQASILLEVPAPTPPVPPPPPPPATPPATPPAASVEELLSGIEGHLRTCESLASASSWDALAREARKIMPLALELKGRRSNLGWVIDAQSLYDNAEEVAEQARERDIEDVFEDLSDLRRVLQKFPR
jgi:hypothetical protein